MRRFLLTGLAALVAVGSTMAVAGSLISSSTGSVIQLGAPPSSVALNALENATAVVTFQERNAVTLAAAVKIDAAAPGTYSVFPRGTATVPAGSVVDSYLVHSDPVAKGYIAHRTGSVTFSDDIVGVIGATARLAASDGALGAPGTTYSGTLNGRGLETGGVPPDRFTISTDHRTVNFDITSPYVMDEFRVITAPPVLSTDITDSPDPVTAGNDVQYGLTVTNHGSTPVADVHVVDTLPAGTSLVTASAPGPCNGTGPVDCTLGTLGVGASAQAFIVVTSPATVPAGGTITDAAVGTPGANVTATQVTTVEEPAAGVSKGFVLPGDSIGIDGTDPATLTLPDTGTGAPVLITQGDGSFCDGPCQGPATTISEFPGYSDPNQPIHLALVYNFSDSPDNLFDAALAYNATIFKNEDPLDPNAGTPVPFCTTLGSGIADPHPCVNSRTITQPTFGTFVVTFDIVYLSGDPRFARK